jgi:hypothetical protein
MTFLNLAFAGITPNACWLAGAAALLLAVARISSLLAFALFVGMVTLLRMGSRVLPRLLRLGRLRPAGQAPLATGQALRMAVF